jgi:hypothetical protein
VIGKDHIDFVELRARIINHEFVGICAARDTRSSAVGRTGSASGW